LVCGEFAGGVCENCAVPTHLTVITFPYLGHRRLRRIEIKE